MIDKRKADELRARLEAAAGDLEPDERLWFEVRRVRRAGRARWKAAVCRTEAVESELATYGSAVFELDYPSQLAEWLGALGVQPVQPIPSRWNDLVFFGCKVEVNGSKPRVP
ncbi:hypothetical protein [Sinomonas susongensis]|uniref:hypothetical protein n=1 Tax=Sinomonas susongensis TaxID=1324851 RepID=UPI00110896C3|nr:hypothetical protein [Sinomonas susongensis]